MSASEHFDASTVQRLVRLFLKGLATIIPIALTLLIVLWLAGLAESGVGYLIKLFLPESWYLQGMGFVGGIALVMAIGLLSQLWLFRKLIDLGEMALDRMPLVKTVFRATKDFVDYFSGEDGSRLNRPSWSAIPTSRSASWAMSRARTSPTSRLGTKERSPSTCR